MGTLQEELDLRADALRRILCDANKAILKEEGTAAPTLKGLPDMLSLLDKPQLRVERGTATLTESALQVEIPCTANPKLVVFKADAKTSASLEELSSRHSIAIFAINVQSGINTFVYSSTGSAIVGNNEVSTFSPVTLAVPSLFPLFAGTYEWMSYDWDVVPESTLANSNLSAGCDLWSENGAISIESNQTAPVIPCSAKAKIVILELLSATETQAEIAARGKSGHMSSLLAYNWQGYTLNGLAVGTRYSDSSPAALKLNCDFANGLTVLSGTNASYPFMAGIYRWTAYYWNDEADIAELIAATPLGQKLLVGDQVYYGESLLSSVMVYTDSDAMEAAGTEESVLGAAVLHLIPNGEGTYRAALVGSGAVPGFSKAKAIHAWASYEPYITEIFISEGITSLGDYLFARMSEAKTVVNASSVLTSLGQYPFYNCFALRRAEGFGSVIRIGKGAFFNCPSLQLLDLDQNACREIGFFGLHICSAEDSLFLKEWENTAFDICASRAQKWDSQTLAEIQKKAYTDTAILRVPNPDMHNNYDFKFCSGFYEKEDGTGGYQESLVKQGGCVGLSLYHAYNAVHAEDGMACEGFEAFWKDVLHADTQLTDVTKWVKDGSIHPLLVYQNGTDSAGGYREGVSLGEKGEILFLLPNFHGGTDEWEILGEMLRRLGWTMSEKLLTTGAEQKGRIDASLHAGIPVLASVNHFSLNEESERNEGQHMVCIVGCDRETDKLTVVDSTWAAGTKGHIYTVSYEDLFYNYETDAAPLKNSIILLSP